MTQEQQAPPDRLLDAVAQAASAWRDPDHPARARAVAATLEAPNRFTEESLAYAINQHMSRLNRGALETWVQGRRTPSPLTVGVAHPASTPMDGLRDFLAVVLVGHHYRGLVSPASPALLPAFVEEVRRYATNLRAEFVSPDDLLEGVEAVIATESDESDDGLEEQLRLRGFDPDRCLLRPRRFSVAVIDGYESEDEREGLAEDALLFDGCGPRSVALIWAPQGLSPDAYLESFAAFRSVFPVHPDTPGTLIMQKAFLDATGRPHAYGEELEFLLSKGDPEVQSPGHFRWTEYEHLDDVLTWLDAHASELELVVARSALARRLPDAVCRVEPGEAHRPPLDRWPGGVDTISFLVSLASS